MLSETLQWCFPMVAVVLAFLVITGIIVYTVYRQKRYGAFCCLKPKMRYRVEEVEEFHRSDCPSPPPSYDMSSSNNLAPPDYHDALQDVLLDSGDNRETTESRYTTWSNIPIGTALPEYSAVTSENMPNTELGAESQGDNQGTSNSTTRLNSLSYTTTSAPPLNVVSSDELITGPVTISHPPPSNEIETTICPEKQSMADRSSNVGCASHNSN